MTKFSELGLNPLLLKALEGQGYTNPTPIQAQAIPPLMSGHDLLGIAQTGTGKTAAFALPILHHILKNRSRPIPGTTRALILSPTRELAAQIADSFKTYGAGQGLAVATIYGGVKYGAQYKALAGGLDILVATPGRLIDHIQQKSIDLKAVEFFVLDEADQMLDMGFVKPIRQIVAKLPSRRQNLFFSATMPKEIATLVTEILKDPKKVEVTPEATTAERVVQTLLFVEHVRKRALLQELYADAALNRTLVFTRTKHSADKVTAYLQAGGVESAAIHGNKSQGQRERALEAFKAGRVRALVATDIAARGIDIDDVSHVVNFDLPQVPEAYVHRIGRTARAGRGGTSISFCADDERNLLKAIQKTIRMTIPSFDRRKDPALKLLDEAIMAAKPAEKPSTPERVRVPKTEGRRHVDPDAEFVHKRARNRPDKRKPEGRPAHAASKRPAFDPMQGEFSAVAAVDAAPRGEGRRERPAHAEGRPHRRPERPRSEGRDGRDEDRNFGGRAHPAKSRDERPRDERPRGERPQRENPSGKFGDKPSKPFGKGGDRPFAGKGSGKPFAGKGGKSFGSRGQGRGPKPGDAPADRNQGAQLRRRAGPSA